MPSAICYLPLLALALALALARDAQFRAQVRVDKAQIVTSVRMAALPNNKCCPQTP